MSLPFALLTCLTVGGLKFKDSLLALLHVDDALPHSPDLPFKLLNVGKWLTPSYV